MARKDIKLKQTLKAKCGNTEGIAGSGIYFGATTLSTMTLSVTTISIMTLSMKELFATFSSMKLYITTL
jgi:hypothetical protein